MGLARYKYQLLMIDGDRVIRQRTNPCRFDTDDDGLSDGVEISLNYSSGPSDATNPDSDGDGILDGIEDRNQDGQWDPDVGIDPW